MLGLELSTWKLFQYERKEKIKDYIITATGQYNKYFVKENEFTSNTG